MAQPRLGVGVLVVVCVVLSLDVGLTTGKHLPRRPLRKSAEAEYYRTVYIASPRFAGRNRRAATGYRAGHATKTNSCGRVRSVPSSLRTASGMKPNGLASFYQKYTEAYGIPVVASRNVADDALRRACYTLRFLLADHSGIRQSFYRMSGRLAVIGKDEGTTDMPEFSHMDDWWNQRTRGLGATINNPVSSGGEENVLCLRKDRYPDEDIFLHEAAHAVDSLGAAMAIPGWGGHLYDQFAEANATGLWATTYSMESPAEYFAEGVQSFFNVNAYQAVSNGIHGPISTRAKLKNYDSKLYNLISEVFPCQNTYLKRCESTRAQEYAQTLKMDCDLSADYVKQYPASSSSCSDDDDRCGGWASSGECVSNPQYMLTNCKSSCNVCDRTTTTTTTQGTPGCKNDHHDCDHWASIGECAKNPAYMAVHCQKSCDTCVTAISDGCIEDNNSCAYWGKTGECNTNPGYMLKHCMKSCGLCI